VKWSGTFGLWHFVALLSRKTKQKPSALPKPWASPIAFVAMSRDSIDNF